MKARGVASCTIVGFGGDYPRARGNCFFVFISEEDLSEEDLVEGKLDYRKIINMGYENLKELLKRKEISWPIEIQPIGEKWAKITDPRVPVNWLTNKPCSICFPEEYHEHIA